MAVAESLGESTRPPSDPVSLLYLSDEKATATCFLRRVPNSRLVDVYVESGAAALCRNVSLKYGPSVLRPSRELDMAKAVFPDLVVFQCEDSGVPLDAASADLELNTCFGLLKLHDVPLHQFQQRTYAQLDPEIAQRPMAEVLQAAFHVALAVEDEAFAESILALHTLQTVRRGLE